MLTLLLIASATLGQDAVANSPKIDEGVALFERQELEQAEVSLNAALSEENLARKEVIRLLHHLGVVRSYLENPAGAREAFTRLLAVSPAHFLPYTISPETAVLFDEVRKKSEPLGLRLWLPLRAAWDEEVSAEIEVTGNPTGELSEAAVLVRRQGGANYRAIPVAIPEVGRRVSVELGRFSRPTLDEELNLEVALVGKNERGWEVFVGPDPRTPQVVVVGALERPWYAQEGTMWILAGTATAAVVTTAVLAGLFWPPPEDVPLGVVVK